MKEIFTTAFYRGAMLGALAGVSAAMSAWLMTTELREIIAPSVIAAIAVFAARGFGEGSIDAQAHFRQSVPSVSSDEPIEKRVVGDAMHPVDVKPPE